MGEIPYSRHTYLFHADPRDCLRATSVYVSVEQYQPCSLLSAEAWQKFRQECLNLWSYMNENKNDLLYTEEMQKTQKTLIFTATHDRDAIKSRSKVK